MWFLGCLLVLSLTWFIWYPVGRLLAGLAPARIRPAARLYFSPALGLAVFALLAGVSCWLVPLSSLPCGLLLLGLGSLAWWRLPDRGRTLQCVLMLSVATVFSSYPILAQIQRFDGYNPFNDTYTYLEHAQWLQDHAFREAAKPSGFQPAATQIAIYQRLQERMGASFMLAWLQSALGFRWSYEVYPVLAGALLTGGAWAMAGILAYFTRCNRVLAILIGTLAVTLPGGFRFGAIYGFLPQTAGLTFAIVTLLLFAVWLAQPCAANTKRSTWSTLAIAVPLAAGTACYFALLPVVALSMLATAMGVLWLQRPSLLPFTKQLFLLTGVTLLLLNIETLRAYSAILFNMTANVGTPIGWKLSEFVGHALGMYPGAWETPYWVLGGPILSICAGLLLLAIGLWRLLRQRTAWVHVVGFAAFCGIGALLFVKFHFFTPLPPGWVVGQGSSWSAYKAIGWLGPVIIILCGIGLVSMLRWLRSPRFVSAVLLVVMLGFTIAANHADAERAIAGFRDLSGSPERPYETLLALRRFLDATPPNQVLNLDIPPEGHKLRQLLVYFLRDHRLASDWSTDGYIGSGLPDNERTRPAPVGSPRLYLNAGTKPQNLPTFGRITVDLESRDYVGIKSTKATYGREEDQSGWWYWVDNRIEFLFAVQIKSPATISPSVWLYPVDATTVLYCEISLGDRPVKVFPVKLASDGRCVGLPPIPVKAEVSETLKISFYTLAPARELGRGDPRQVTFMLKNLTFAISPVGAE